MKGRARGTLALAAAVAAVQIAGCPWFAPGPDPAPARIAREPIDFAELERRHPLTLEERGRLTPAGLAQLDQEALDRIYARLTAGPVPDGSFEGDVFLPRGQTGHLRAVELASGMFEPFFGEKQRILEDAAKKLWKGKVFEREARVLRNRVENLQALRQAGLLEGEPKARIVAGKPAWLLFPARIYCGQSLLDSRRESIVIDYLFTDEIEGYLELPDHLAGRRGLRVRDEIRMVRPGFYLGRAYIDRVFFVNFTLHNEDTARRDGPAFLQSGETREECWPGTQQRRVVAR